MLTTVIDSLFILRLSIAVGDSIRFACRVGSVN